MKRKLCAVVVSAVLSVAAGAGLWGESGLRPWNHAANPAFFVFGDRTVVELGTSSEVAFGNSAVGLSDIFSRVLVVDLDEVYANTPDDGLRFGVGAAAEAHLALQFGKLGLGFYADSLDLSRTVIPRTFIGLLAQGTELDQTYSGSAQILERAFAQAGAFAAYEVGGFVFAAKFSAFAPLLYSGSNAKASFVLETAADGVIQGELSGSGDVYSSFGEEGFAGYGFNASFGVVRTDGKGKPRYGGALNNIPIVAARPGFLIEIEQFRYEFEATDLLDRLNQGNDIFSTATQGGGVDTRTLAAPDRPKVHMPFSVSGFYRFAIPVVDIIPSAEVLLQAPVRLNAGVTVEGNVFPAKLFSLALGWSDYLWQASLGLRVPLRVFELSVQIASVGTEFVGVFDGRGLGASVALALGY